MEAKANIAEVEVEKQALLNTLTAANTRENEFLQEIKRLNRNSNYKR